MAVKKKKSEVLDQKQVGGGGKRLRVPYQGEKGKRRATFPGGAYQCLSVGKWGAGETCRGSRKGWGAQLEP